MSSSASYLKNCLSTNSVVVGGKTIGESLRQPTRVGKDERGRICVRARNAIATAEPLSRQQQPILLSPPEKFIEDYEEEVVVAESEKYDAIGDGSVVVAVGKIMTFDGVKGIMVEFETRVAKQKELEEK